MSKGTIAQIGTPRDIYFAPRNRFVAEFIGAANIIEASVEDGHLVLPGGRQPITSHVNLAVAVAMVRPEAISLVDAGAAALTGIVDSVSFNGDRQRLVVSNAAVKPLTIEASNTVQAKTGERVGLSIAPEAVRLLPLED
jgi:putative spermidine/putrescine transport system ATP-binding protein